MNIYTAKHARRAGETHADWVARLDYANRDINQTLRLTDDAAYGRRLYAELDEVRAAQLRASREVA